MQTISLCKIFYVFFTKLTSAWVSLPDCLHSEILLPQVCRKRNILILHQNRKAEHKLCHPWNRLKFHDLSDTEHLNWVIFLAELVVKTLLHGVNCTYMLRFLHWKIIYDDWTWPRIYIGWTWMLMCTRILTWENDETVWLYIWTTWILWMCVADHSWWTHLPIDIWQPLGPLSKKEAETHRAQLQVWNCR